MITKKDWMLTTKDIYLRSDFNSKDDIKNLGGMYDGEKKRWFIPRGVNPLDFRSYWAVLDCPFEEKDKVKRRGARFDKSIKKWVVPERFDYGLNETKSGLIICLHVKLYLGYHW